MAIIDMGSNSVKMVCYSAHRTGTYRPYHRESFRVRLDEYNDGVIREPLINRLIDVLLLFRNIATHEDVDKILPVATSALRSAHNQKSVLSRIYDKTGFKVNVLSGNSEALYSYAGAADHLNIPSCMFFDLGGGSIELVSSRNHTIIKALSVPLGALVLTRKFAGKDDFNNETIHNLRQYVRENLPSTNSMGLLGNDASLVGVGGALRTVAKYVQAHVGYPLKKLHNYSMSASSINAAASDILSKDVSDLAGIYEIGRGRADIIKAGIVTISEILSKYNFEKVHVCSTGLREGVLAMATRYAEFDNMFISPYHVRELIRAPSGTLHIPPLVLGVINSFKSSNLLYDEESLILQSAAINLELLRAFRDADDFLYRVMDMPSTFSHRRQLLASLCLTYSKKPKRTKLLIKKYSSIITKFDEQMIKKLAPILELCDLLITTNANAYVQFDDNNKMLIAIKRNQRELPYIILAQTCQGIGEVLNTEINTKFIL
ncbi:MAG: hypothetical protein F4W68_04465 [Cenarchaeum sp. SB0661_bin_35]|nr:hypothetical protein [Cenarchaeum sp. SB0666_bin_15]MYB46535.1 hypothetical protein [Cenarchaeum sp. SB0662_bin_33]MYC79734.1 hypothetical protein [Cenarchaeum sp. SB0661_bin_35]MYD58991.1 hypothetical protein [Cenarchaeum sp. SB0678_bin_8]